MVDLVFCWLGGGRIEKEERGLLYKRRLDGEGIGTFSL